LEIEGKFCLEIWQLDSLDNLVRSEDGLVTIESIGGGRYLITQELLLGDQKIFSTLFLKNYPDFLVEEIIY
jgi:hypothetical protein